MEETNDGVESLRRQRARLVASGQLFAVSIILKKDV